MNRGSFTVIKCDVKAEQEKPVVACMICIERQEQLRYKSKNE